MSDGLYVPLAEGDLALVPLTEAHREELRAACAADAEIWQIYSTNWAGEGFDPQFDKLLTAPERRAYAILHQGALIGMTAWIALGVPGWSIEIGNSYIAPSARGTGVNGRIKRLMLDHAFACGLERVVFLVDAVNARSRAAVLKLAAREEALLRHERRTWTGRTRDTVLFAILREEWLR
jgi:RimJ/RimL family protein N-acetyltransferase